MLLLIQAIAFLNETCPKIMLCCLQYSQLGELSVGAISYAEDENGLFLPVTICKEYYKRGSLNPSDEAYDIDAQLETRKFFLNLISSIWEE